MTPTPDPSACRGLAPSGPDCPTVSPGVSPTVAPVKQPADGGLGSGVDGVLGTVIDLLPWILVGLLLAVVVALLVDRARRRPALVASAAGPAAAPAPQAPAPRNPLPPPAPTGPPAPAGLPPALIGDLLTLADLATTPAVASQVRRMLRSAGIEPIEPAVGTPLDLDVHEVVATAPAPDPGQHERVARLHRPGWRRGPEVIRPAAVELWVHTPPTTPTLPR